MTLVERRIANGKTYEVRRVGRALRLYTDGVLHTHFDATQPISGRVWDLLALPGIVTRARRVLVLGVAGGAVIRQLLAFASPTHIDAVDLDATHLALGLAHFGLDDPRIHLHHEDARTFVARKGRGYDLVIDDVFLESKGQPRRAITYDTAWANAVRRRLTSRGVLVINSAGLHEIKGTALADPLFRERFNTVITLETETAGNVVYALSRVPLEARRLRRDTADALGASAARLQMKVRTVHRASKSDAE